MMTHFLKAGAILTTMAAMLVVVDGNLVVEWSRVGDVVFQLFPEPVNQATAKSRCEELGGNLAAALLRYPDAVQYFIDYVDSMPHRDGQGATVWIGYDKRDSTDFEWVDGGAMNPETTVFAPNQPDGTGDCIQIWFLSEGKFILDDTYCSVEKHFICEVTV